MSNQAAAISDQPKLLGHPVGLYTLFFAEMWERFSYYGMRALLVFYMLKGFLGYGDKDAYTVYGAYTALVYMTPFFGGMIADRILGARRAVVLGGLFMAAGHLTLTVENEWAFFTALALLIVGNGFFKPNISTIVGTLYPPGSPKRDGGFTIFYMGINLGAAMAPLLCGYIGETYGWHYGFGLATLGMLTGTAIFVAPAVPAQLSMFGVAAIAGLNVFVIPRMFDLAPATQNLVNLSALVFLVLAGIVCFRSLNRGETEDSELSKLIARGILLSGAVAAAIGLFTFRPDNAYAVAVNVVIGTAMLVAGLIATIAIGRGGLPREAGAAPAEEVLRRPSFLGVPTEWAVYLLAFFAIPILMLLVSGFAPLTEGKHAISVIPDSLLSGLGDSALAEVAKTFLSEMSKPAGLVLVVCGIGALIYLFYETVELSKIPRERMYVVLILTFFSMLFWSFFEQAGSSVNNFTDRNVDRVIARRTISESDIGKTIELQPTQEQLGYHNGDELFTLDKLTKLRDENQKDPDANPDFTIQWKVAEDNVGMVVASRSSEIAASTFQSVNPIFILIFGLIFSALWGYLGARGLEPSTPVKFALGLLQLGLGFGVFWWGAQHADSRGIVSVVWLLLGYLLHTTGELCLSPVGLSMVTKLSPKRLVSTVMGVWFLATAFSQLLAAIIAQFTGVSHGGGEKEGAIPPPSETVNVYGSVFGKIAIAAIVSSLICFALVPFLKRWMHEGEDVEE